MIKPHSKSSSQSRACEERKQESPRFGQTDQGHGKRNSPESFALYSSSEQHSAIIKCDNRFTFSAKKKKEHRYIFYQWQFKAIRPLNWTQSNIKQVFWYNGNELKSKWCLIDWYIYYIYAGYLIIEWFIWSNIYVLM